MFDIVGDALRRFWWQGITRSGGKVAGEISIVVT